MPAVASSRYQLDVEPVAPRSFWRKFVFPRLFLGGNLAAEAVAREEGQPRPSAFGASQVVVRDLGSGDAVWHVDASDLDGGTTPEQLLDSVERDLVVLDVDAFRAQYGIAPGS